MASTQPTLAAAQARRLLLELLVCCGRQILADGCGYERHTYGYFHQYLKMSVEEVGLMILPECFSCISWRR